MQSTPQQKKYDQQVSGSTASAESRRPLLTAQRSMAASSGSDQSRDPPSPHSSFMGQLGVMLRRNLLLKRKNPKLMSLEILIPLCFVAIFGLIGYVVDKRSIVVLPPIPKFSEEPFTFHFGNELELAYAPHNSKTDQLMRIFKDYASKSVRELNVLSYESQDALLVDYKAGKFKPGIVAIIFDDSNLNTLSYAIRPEWDIMPKTSPPYYFDRTDPNLGECTPRNYNASTAFGPVNPSSCRTNSYAKLGFSLIQTVISTAYMRMKLNVSGNALPLPLMSSVMLPDAEVRLYDTGEAMMRALPATQVLNILGLYVIFLVIYVVTEREKKHIENMKIMGLRPTVYWLSWVIIYEFLMTVVSTIMLLMAMFFNVWPRSNFFLMLLACIGLINSLIAIGLCLAPLFRKPLTAAMVLYLVELILFVLAMLEDLARNIPDYAKFLLALLPSSSFYMCFSRIAKAEAFDDGVNFGNAYKEAGFNVAHAVGMLWLDTFIYSLLAVYIGKITRNGDSPAESVFFFLKPSYWRSSRKGCANSSVDMDELFESGDVDRVPNHLRSKRAVVLNGLTKIFPGKKQVAAVDNFNFEMYEGEIVAVLGHNGAGKSTMMNMITGMLQPTSGCATVYGSDMSMAADMINARKLIGYCPQHNMLFEDFTIQEHLVFFARLKGFSRHEAEEQCMKIMDEIDIKDQANVLAKNLSGGQKRRLSIAIAVIGRPKVLILDEPSSGVDIYNQRFLWDLIRGFRAGRCIIVATQSMQEADVLADRKLIMSRGKLRCAGSSLFLKNRFGSGYYLTMTVEKDHNEGVIDAFVARFIRGAERTRSHAGELCYVLPKRDMGEYGRLFEEMEKDKSKLKIGTFGISLTTLEEIFLRLADESHGEKLDLNVFKSRMVADRQREIDLKDCSRIYPPKKGTVPAVRKLVALCKVRALLMCRSAYAVVYQLVIPILSMLTLGGIFLASQAISSRSPVEGSLSGEEIGHVLNSVEDFKGGFFMSNDTGKHLEKLTSGLAPVSVKRYDDLVSGQFLSGGYIMKDVASSGAVRAAAIAYNSTATHVIPYLTNRLLSAMFQALTGTAEHFHFRPHPLPNQSTIETPPFDASLIGPTLIGLALALIPSVFGMDVCRDRLIKARSQIRMKGCSFWLYWISALTVHLAQYWISFTIIVSMIYAFGIKAMTEKVDFGMPAFSNNSREIVTEVVPASKMLYFGLIFVFYSGASVVFSYCASFMFSRLISATVVLPFVMSQVAYLMYMTVFLLGLFNKETTADHLHRIFACIFPPYGIFGGLHYLIGKPPKTEPVTLWQSNIPIVMIAFVGFRFYGKLSKRIIELKTAHQDEDVLAEADRVAAIKPIQDSKHTVIMRGLRKEFSQRDSRHGWRRRTPATKKIAVNCVTIDVPRGEIFGLLGPNGAGKTTTLSMVSGEVTPTAGDVHVNGFDIHVQTQQAIEEMGSCPQIDTLWDELTMREHLELFTILADLHKERRTEDIEWFANGLDIKEHMDKKSSALSGGTKRKLTFTISMIGNPPVVMLDEPSTGMDPQSKRHLWGMIQNSFCNTRGAILTTHSMEEADALCDRIGILVQGELKCIGSSQHLKNKFGSGYLLEVKLSLPADVSSDDVKTRSERVKDAVSKLFPQRCHLEEDLYGRLVFAVENRAVTSLGRVMRELEHMKRSLELEEYSFSQSTIEQVFLHFAKMQDAVAMCDSNMQCAGVTVQSSGHGHRRHSALGVAV
ncbi:ABC-type organic anion transporter ABCA8B-like isoform X2 [Paramacrobiotus metropolitanus]|uniref:ABC-type organic anion transporter ABCA8B-like isoform X2 n=1 Tax=Paramacrobiotus metropolitanus TaxID=2943436 RepID=UPI002445D8C6|nr:ABC-type organic anion transporter ABCA8B-like isoform X2 [Paramacrobiotus metropolitanus]